MSHNKRPFTHQDRLHTITRIRTSLKRLGACPPVPHEDRLVHQLQRLDNAIYALTAAIEHVTGRDRPDHQA
jgi:hypothetical protein